MSTETSARLHLYVLLDRSGSMEPMRGDVVAGFNELLAEQKAATANGGLEPRLTLVQFDDAEPREVLVDAARVSKAPMLDTESFAPRGMTPLLDATMALLRKAQRRVTAREKAGRSAEDIVVVTITDGEENASRRTTRAALLRQIRYLERKGWTFAFLGAGLDAYAEAGALGYDDRSVQSWAHDGTGAKAAFDSVSKATLARRSKLATAEAFDRGDFFEGDKTAEADRDRRGAGACDRSGRLTNVAAPPSRVCPLCSLQDYVDPPVALAEGLWQFVCRGPHGVYVFDVKSNNDVAAYPQGLAADLGLYEDLPKCVTDETAFVEYRYGLAHPKEYGQLVSTYGHRADGTHKGYSASIFIASTLGRIAREGVLRLEFGKGTGYWDYNDPISYWAKPGETEPTSRLTWAQFAADNELEVKHWPL